MKCCVRARYEHLQGNPLRGTQYYASMRLLLVIPILSCLPFPQNFNVPHGKNYYMNGVFSSGPKADVARTLVSRLPEISKESSANFTVVYELLPKEKTLSVPINATAHVRVPHFNVLVISTWNDKDTPNKVDVLRSATAELARIVLQGEKVITDQLNTGYGNYSEQQERMCVESRMLILYTFRRL